MYAVRRLLLRHLNVNAKKATVGNIENFSAIKTQLIVANKLANTTKKLRFLFFLQAFE